MHADVPVKRPLYAPAAHDVHTADDTPATTLPYAPAPQDVHAPVPVLRELYCPAMHDVHTADVVADATLP